ncbi:RPM1 interacting protein 13 [Vitis vinifera]|uniref:RPM1 interacting protein 13 n=1 Tax=Vitis vinifera TaxID=29760 RepID=UPI002883257F|nr:RPM1 interacting protein 13 [Vitis vinifera]
MGEEGNEMMEKLESPSTKEGEEERKVIQIYSTSSEEEPIICLRDMDMKKLEETQDCFILDFDPFDSNIHLSSLSITEEHADSDDADLHVISQKGQCYCYVCDSAAPCKYWTAPQPGHCHATEQDAHWKLQRKCRMIEI